MKGPIVFLLSLAAVAVVGGVVVLPAFRPAAAPAIAPPGDRQETDRLVDGLRLAPPGGIPELSGGGSGETRFEVPWERLPECLRALAAPRRQAPRSLRVDAAPDPARCRVEIRW